MAILGSRGFPSTYGGYETLVRYLVDDWVRKGHDVTVYCRDHPKGRYAWVVNGAQCRWTPGYDTKTASTLTFGATSHIDAAIRRFDALLVLNIANGFYTRFLRAARIPTVLNTDGLEWERGKWGSAAKKVFYTGAQLSAKYADVLICDSEAIGDVWNREFGVESRFIPYGGEVKHSVGADRLKVLGIQPGRYALVVARLAPENNVELTLDAYARVKSSCPLVVVGSANSKSPVEARLAALDSAGSVRWLGHVADQELLGELWANAGVYIHGHSVGGTNPALLQALGYGAPTLALETRFNREVIGYSDQLYPAAASSLANAIDRLFANRELRREWTKRGQETVRLRYDWQHVCDAYEEAMREAAEVMRDRRTAASR